MRYRFRTLSRVVAAVLVPALSAAILLPAPHVAKADESVLGAGVFGAPFLSIPVGARLMSNPDVVVGMSPDASLTFSNPAFLTGVHSTELFASSANWLEDMRFSAVSAAFPLGDGRTVLSLGSTLLYTGALQGYDGALNVVTEDTYYDMGFTAGVSRRFGTLSLGVAGTYVRQHIFPSNGNGYSLSMGASWWLGPNFLHAVAKDVGGSVSFDGATYSIDSRYAFGYGRVVPTSWGDLFAGAQMVLANATADRLELGVSYHINKMFTIRAAAPDALGDASGSPAFTGGLGVHYGNVRVEYAYTPQEYFSSAHTFSMVFSLGRQGSGTLADGSEVRTESRPVENTAPVISESQIRSAAEADAAPEKSGTAQPPSQSVPPAPAQVAPAPAGEAGSGYVIVAGTHPLLASARSEARALEALNILTEIEPIAGGRYRVIVGRYSDRDKAESALQRYEKQGHRFTLVGPDAQP